MELPTYQAQYDKVTEAYFRGEIQPLDPKKCFCGTLSPHGVDWYNLDTHFDHPYSYYEYRRMEAALFRGIRAATFKPSGEYSIMTLQFPTEDAVFNGMVEALEEMRKIHIAHGEQVDTPSLTKRDEKTYYQYPASLREAVRYDPLREAFRVQQQNVLMQEYAVERSRCRRSNIQSIYQAVHIATMGLL